MLGLRYKQNGFTMYNLLAMAAVVAGVFVIGSLVKNQIDIQLERKQYLAAQKEVNTLGNKIAKATNPDKHEAVAYCDYGSVKFGRGGRTCWARYYLIYKNTTYEKAEATLLENKSLFTNSEVRLKRNIDSEKFIKSISFTIKDFPSRCSAILYYNNDDEYVRYSKFSLNLPFEASQKDAIISLDCSGEAKAEHFPVKE